MYQVECNVNVFAGSNNVYNVPLRAVLHLENENLHTLIKLQMFPGFSFIGNCCNDFVCKTSRLILFVCISIYILAYKLCCENNIREVNLFILV